MNGQKLIITTLIIFFVWAIPQKSILCADIPTKLNASSSQDFKADNYASYESLLNTYHSINKPKSSSALADLLNTISLSTYSAEDQKKVANIESEIIYELRKQVRSEVADMQDKALKSKNYREGIGFLRDAGNVLALYPMSDDKAVVNEATYLSSRQSEILTRLELIRRQRYNYWAATQIQLALKIFREQKKEGVQKAIKYIRTIEPSLLEISVSNLYSYTIEQLVDEFKKDEKANITKAVTNPSIQRVGLENF